MAWRLYDCTLECDGKVVGGGGWYEDTTILPLTERGMMVEGAEGRTCPGVSW